LSCSLKIRQLIVQYLSEPLLEGGDIAATTGFCFQVVSADATLHTNTCVKPIQIISHTLL